MCLPVWVCVDFACVGLCGFVGYLLWGVSVVSIWLFLVRFLAWCGGGLYD